MPKFNKDKDVNEYSQENPYPPVKNMAYWKAKNEATSPFPAIGAGKILGLVGKGLKGRWAGKDAQDAHMADAYKNIYG